MKPYGGGCKCCKGMMFGDNHHKRTGKRMAAAREVAKELDEHRVEKDLQAWREMCERVSLPVLNILTNRGHKERSEIAQEILERRLRDEDEL